jgi:rifampin ADP-ribosylating transferase
VEQGAPDGVPVVLLHGYVDSRRSFERLLPLLPPSIRAFAVTQRGHGDADRPASGYGLGRFASDVAEFLDAVGIEAAVIVGDSSGGYVAQRFAVDRGFMATQLFNPVAPAFLDAVVGESAKVPARVWNAVLRGLLEADPPTATATISAPTTIRWGERDAYCPRSEQDALAAGIPGSRLVTYEGTGHAIIWERPERVAADLVALTAAL